MNIEKVRELHQASPFRPFVVHMSDGRNLRVDHPEFISLSPRGDELSLWESDGTHHFVDVALVTDLDRRKTARKRTGNRKKSSS